MPLDKKMLKNSIEKTGKAIIFDDSNRTCGFAAELAAFISDECFTLLKAPVKRITRADVPVPFSRSLESYVLPDEKKLTEEILKVHEFCEK